MRRSSHGLATPTTGPIASTRGAARRGAARVQVLVYAETDHVFPLPEWMRIPGTGFDRYGVGENGLGEALSVIPDDTRVDETGTTVMTRSQYVVICNTHPDEGQRPYRAILLKVLERG